MDVTACYKKVILEAEKSGFKPTNQTILVSIPEQKLWFVEGGALERAAAFTVSTSRNPPSCIEDSGGTPTGLHRVAEKIGGDEPLGMVFRGRQPTGEFYWECDRNHQITTRILWLEGLQSGHNRGGDRDSKQRYIYIHGTNHEDLLGVPHSGGCINMSNTDVLDLYRRTAPLTLVWIEE